MKYPLLLATLTGIACAAAADNDERDGWSIGAGDLQFADDWETASRVDVPVGF
jgi:hypothetical protein